MMLIETPEITSPMVHFVVAELQGFIWCTRLQTCTICSAQTAWVDLAFEAPLCPGGCSERMQDDFNWAKALGGFGLTAMRCPNRGCNPPKFCGLCKGTGEIPG